MSYKAFHINEIIKNKTKNIESIKNEKKIHTHTTHMVNQNIIRSKDSTAPWLSTPLLPLFLLRLDLTRSFYLSNMCGLYSLFIA